MKNLLFVLLTCSVVAAAQAQTKIKKSLSTKQCCADDCEYKSRTLACKLTTPELKQRKEIVIKSLKSQMLVRKELKNGYAFKFAGTDKMVDELTEFIKTERACCDFFIFKLFVAGDQKEAWLEITGPKGAKEFIVGELGM